DKENVSRTEVEYSATTQALGIVGERYQSLQRNSEIMKRRFELETRLWQACVQNQRSLQLYGDSWGRLDETLNSRVENDFEYFLLEEAAMLQCRLFFIARELLRITDETDKAQKDRLPEYCDPWLELRKRRVLEDDPIYEDLEIMRLADSLNMF